MGSCDIAHTVALPVIYFGRLAVITLIFALGSCTMHVTIEIARGFGVSDTANITGSG